MESRKRKRCLVCQMQDRLVDINALDSKNVQWKSKLNTCVPELDWNITCFLCATCCDIVNNLCSFRERCVKSYNELQDFYLHCTECDSSFRTTEDLCTHLDSHLKTFKCADCDLTFPFQADLDGHNTKIHAKPPEKPAKSGPVRSKKKKNGKREVKKVVLKKSKGEKKVEEAVMEILKDALPVENEAAKNVDTDEVPKEQEIVVDEPIEEIKKKTVPEIIKIEDDVEMNVPVKEVIEEVKVEETKIIYGPQCSNELNDDSNESIDQINAIDIDDEESQDEKFPYYCEVCGKGFNYKSNFTRHKRTHNNMKHFCDKCGRCFDKASALSTHQRMHDGEKKFRCHYCDHSCFTTFALRRHIKERHEKREKLKCSECPQEYRSEKKMAVHLARVHKIGVVPKRHVCKECDEVFSDGMELRRHVRLHKIERPFSCEKCNERFQYSFLYNQHLLMAHGDHVAE